jgi:RNA polymerase sigma-70 factor (ECF subfamily)
MNEHRLLERFAAGDSDAIRTVYAAYSQSVFSLALQALGDRALAEEAMQDTFVKAWKAAGRYDPGRPLGPWIYSIARRVAVDGYRRERRHRGHGTLNDNDVTALPDHFQRLWETWEIRSAIGELSVDDQFALEAAHYRSLTAQEAADEVGVPVGTMKSRLSRAHQKLAGRLGHLDEATA